MLTILLALLVVSSYPLYRVQQQIGSKLPDFGDELRELRWGQLNFVHTTDTHGWYLGHLNQKQYGADWGDFISFTEHLRSIADLHGTDLLLLDSGDKHDGNGLGDVTSVNGLYSSKIFAEADFDLLTVGNHELYVEAISEHEFNEVVPVYGDKYVSTNVEYKTDDGRFVPFGGATHRVFSTKNQGLKILGLGILFDFDRTNERVRVTPIVELVKLRWFKDLLASYQDDPGLDLILVIGHIPVSHDWAEFQVLHDFIRSYFPHLPIQYFGGHSHIRDFTKLDATSYGLQSGRYCETAGWLSIDNLKAPELKVDRKYIDFNVHSFMHHSNTSNEDFNTVTGLKVSQELGSMSSELKLNEMYGKVPRNYLVNSAPIDDKNNLLNLLSNEILVRLVPESSRGTFSNSRIIIINTGSIRYDLYKGPFTRNSKYIVSPFKNKWNFIPQVPKRVALGILDVLNNQSYLISELDALKRNTPTETPLMLNLRRPESKYRLVPTTVGSSPSIFSADDYFMFRSRSYGYVTTDDFGQDGDDTVHRPFPYYPEPNAIQSYEGTGDYVDVIYYDFIEPQVVFALAELGYVVESGAVYNSLSNKFNVGQLLQDYIQEHWST